MKCKDCFESDRLTPQSPFTTRSIYAFDGNTILFTNISKFRVGLFQNFFVQDRFKSIFEFKILTTFKPLSAIFIQNIYIQDIQL